VSAASRQHRPHLDPVGSPRLERLAGGSAATASPAGIRRFRLAAADGSLAASPRDRAILEQLATAPISSIGRLMYASNAVFLLELDAPDPHVEGEPMRAVYKPARGERPLWDFPGRTLHLRERAAYLLSAALGTEVVPPTALRDGPHGPGSVQLFIHSRDQPLEGEERAAIEAQLRRVALFDVLANNADRKLAHLLVDRQGHLWGIDNALTFLPYPRQRTALLSLGGRDLEPGDADTVRKLQGDSAARAALRASLRWLISSNEVRALEARLDELAAQPWYPRLDHWDGRPFEWW
jgi:hypothetical protein